MSFRNRTFVLLAIGMIFLLSATSCSNITSTKSLFSAIEKRYECNWFNNIKYMISVIRFDDDNTEKRSTCSAEYVRPSQHILKTDMINDDGYIYINDTIYAFVGGELVSSRPDINDFVLVVMDLYGMTAKDAINRINDFGIANTAEFCSYTDTADHKYYIVGIDNYNDNTVNKNQIWFDSKTLLPKMVQRTKDDGHKYAITFDNFIQVGGTGWIPQKITYSKDDKVKIVERIYDAVIPIYEKKKLSVDNFCSDETLNEMQLDPNSNFSLNFMVEP